MAVVSAGIGIVGFIRCVSVIYLPSGIIFIMLVSMILSVAILIPVVSRSNTARGFVRFSFIWVY